MTNNKFQITNNTKITNFKFIYWIFGIVWCLVLGIWNLALADVEILGYYENDLIGLEKRDGTGLVGDLNRLRLRIDSQLIANVNLHLEPEYNLLIKSQDLPLTGVSGLDQLVWDRAYLKIYFPQVDITVGKQRIAWGAGYLWNPTDVFNPFTLSFAVEEEQEAEPEAVRIEVPMGAAGGIDAYIVAGNEWHETTKGIRAMTNLGLYDLSLSYVDLGRGGFQLGFDTTGELFELGVRSEIALISPAGADGYVQSVWGWNYTFENGWGVDMEYFFNGLGEKHKDDYDWTGLLDGNISQLGIDYVYFGVNKMLDEITNIRFSSLINADDLSFIFYPSYNRNIFQNIDLSLEALLPFGEPGSEYMPTDSEDSSGFMGSKVGFVKVRWSF